MSHSNPTDEQLSTILTDAKTIAMVGASSNPEKPSYRIFEQLVKAGYRVIPVNPRETEVHGVPAVASLAEVAGPIDIVNVFRKSEDTPGIADEAVRAQAKVVWLQQGVTSDDAAARASAGGLTVVMDKCIGAAHHALHIAPKV